MKKSPEDYLEKYREAVEDEAIKEMLAGMKGDIKAHGCRTSGNHDSAGIQFGFFAADNGKGLDIETNDERLVTIPWSKIFQCDPSYLRTYDRHPDDPDDRDWLIKRLRTARLELSRLIEQAETYFGIKDQ